MIREAIKYVIMFISLVLIQVLVLNHVQFSGFVNPCIYILFVMLLPINIPRYALLILGFLVGFTVDVFSNSLGINAAASTLIAFVRPVIISGISTREEERSDYPGMKQNSFRWFLYYTIIMVFIHHLAFFYLEVFTFNDFLGTFSRVLLSSVFSIFVIVLSQFLIFRE